ncbi:GNAT family N-acetyltransferase [Fulvivirga ligni]|uniref:GNAT family N-acetyltransferase n=1 Tax=Fulvivirga ligni TaxID=2904246 RepID=UPI001F3E0808|nr:GNAT family N-acetyltransferase [Fulvivirga ligni]UII19439.1 GNAT family N-acetyltransferase [Fulvivirga ligni]
MEIEFKRCTLNELDQLLEISKATYFEAFSAGEASENVQQYVANAFNEDRLWHELNNPFSEFYLAESDGDVVGYIKLNYKEAQQKYSDRNSIELQRIYTVGKVHGQGAGQVLLNEAIRIARQNHAEFLWLGVWDQNPRAIHFYQKNGFDKLGQMHFYMGDKKYTDTIMMIEL